MEKLPKHAKIDRVIIFAGIILLLLMVLFNFYYGIKLTLTTTLLAFIIFIALIVMLFLFRFTVKHPPPWLMKLYSFVRHHQKYAVLVMLSIILLTGLALRFSFLRFNYQSTSDPAHYYSTAKKIIDTSGITNQTTITSQNVQTLSNANYFALFPYLFNYTALLSGSMSVFGQNYLSVIMLNSLFDIAGATLLYFLVKKILKKRRFAIIAFALWMLNPFNVVFCALSLPIIAVNTFIILGIFLTKLLFDNFNNRKFWVYVLILGITLGVGNGFRPIMTVFILSIMLIFIIYLIKKRGKQWLTIAMGSIIMVIAFGGAILANNLVAQRFINAPIAYNASGWSLFLGSNVSTNGQWNETDGTELLGVFFSSSKNAGRTQQEMLNLGIQRYKSNGLVANIKLAIQKSAILLGDQKDGAYNLNSIISLSSRTYSIVTNILSIWTLAMIILAILAMYKLYKKCREIDYITMLIIILLIAFYISSILVEVASRYSTIFWPMLTILAVYGISNIIRNSGRYGLPKLS